ncbi:MAG TPA: MGMT family protein [Gammaproteobacteria bacterium]|nr:MGMT family protein [Gammaproteobacteria bacterium]
MASQYGTMIDKNAGTAYADILETVKRIPRGRVATYGQVAALAGYPRGARLVGTVLQRVPTGTRVPWHRVINASGALSFPRNSEHYRLQRSKLEREGVRFNRERIELERYQWRETELDNALWKPR